jgi:hypothetical protein
MKNKALFNMVWVCTLFGIASCNFQIPETLELKGSPGVYLPLGNPFTGDNSVTHYFDINTIKDLAGGGTEAGVTVYSYKSDSFPDVQTYLVHSQIAEMNLNLSEYVQGLDITDATGTAMPDTFIPGTGISYPFTIPFGQMAEWVTEVEDAQFRVTLTFEGDVPTDVSVIFNINGEDKDGISDTSDSGKLIFTHTPLFLHPQQYKGITVKIRVPVGYSFKPELNFDWERAKIQPKQGDNVYEGKYTFSIGELINYLGKGVSFKTIPTYMYVDLPDGDWEPAIRLSVDGGEPVEKGMVDEPLPPLNQEDDNESIDFNLDDCFEFASFLETLPDSKVNDSIELKYEIETKLVPISKNGNPGKIAIDLIIVLPLEFEVSGSPTIPASLDNEKKAELARYVKLELGDLLPDTGDDDLFGRTGKKDDLFESLDYVKIYLNNCHNTIIKGGFSISIIAGTYSKVLTLDDGGSDDITIDLDELPNPFSPKFEILILKSTIPGEDYGTLSIGSGTPEFNFSLVVEAKAKIDQTITF